MLNVAILMGRLVADPEIRHTPNDIAVTSFTIAVDRSYVKSGAERQADFIDIVYNLLISYSGGFGYVRQEYIIHWNMPDYIKKM